MSGKARGKKETTLMNPSTSWSFGQIKRGQIKDRSIRLVVHLYNGHSESGLNNESNKPARDDNICNNY